MDLKILCVKFYMSQALLLQGRGWIYRHDGLNGEMGRRLLLAVTTDTSMEGTEHSTHQPRLSHGFSLCHTVTINL